MAYRTILLHLDGSTNGSARVELACALAAEHEAHLVGLAVQPPLAIPGTAPTAALIELLSAQWDADRKALTQMCEGFAARARSAGVTQAESRFIDGDPDRMLPLHARYADLLIVGQGVPEAGVSAETMVLDGARPVLIVPHSFELRRVGERVLVAWNASREATRALTDALPLLQRAQQVDVVTVNAMPEARGHGEMPGADIALYLARHGVKANVLPTYGEDAEVGEWLLSRASDLGSDLLVMGAYGHSRLRELVLGGATRTVLESMTVPVLMSR
ncbi:MAG: universal stress protein [Burkholderiales bacterium]|nr:universal stress protein [Burkholderiales bacterium]